MDEYIKAVTEGRVVVGELVRLAIERHIRDIERSKDKDFPYYFDKDEAQRVIQFAGMCRQWKSGWVGKGLEVQPHQAFYFGSIFGWMRKDGTGRRFRTSIKMVGRKNGKTTEAVILALYHILFDNEAGAQVYFTASKEDQAKIAFDDAVKIIKATPELKKKFKIYQKSIVYQNSTMKPLGSDSNTQDGFDPSWGVIDEYHAHRTDGMLNVLESGMGSRRQPMINIITTAGMRKIYPCYSDLRKTAIEVLRGIKQDESLFTLIYELDEGDDWNDPKNWIKANPNLGVCIFDDFLKMRYQKAKNMGYSTEVDFRTKNLNQWTDTAETWIPDDVWMKCDEGEVDVSGMQAWGGLDLARSRDLSAFVLLFEGEGRYHVKTWLFLPEDSAEESQNPYHEWTREGYLILTPGNVIDDDVIIQTIREACETYSIQEICYDRYSASNIIKTLIADEIPMSAFGQGFVSMSEPTKQLEKLVYGQKINHMGNPVMRWMMSNVELRTDPAGNIKIDKGRAENKVDGIVALVMAIGANMAQEPEKVSVYESRGLLEV